MNMARAATNPPLLLAVLGAIVLSPWSARSQEQPVEEQPAQEQHQQAEAQPQTAPATLKCEACGEEFGSPTELGLHQAVEHGRTVPVPVTALRRAAEKPDAAAVRAHLALWRGAGLLLRGDAEEAVPLLKEAAEALPKSAEAQAQLSRALKAAGEDDEAKQHADKARELKPDIALDQPVLPGEEYTFVPREFVEKLYDAYGNSLGKTVPKPVLSELTAWLAGYYYDTGKAEPATTAAQKSVQLDPLNLHGRALLGVMYAEVGAGARAANEVRAALKVDSSDFWVQRAAVMVTMKCRIDVIPPEIMLISPLEGEQIAPRTNFVFAVKDNSGNTCRVTINRIPPSGRARKLKEIRGASGEQRVLWREMKWSPAGDTTIEIVAMDVYQNTSQARFTFKGRT